MVFKRKAYLNAVLLSLISAGEFVRRVQFRYRMRQIRCRRTTAPAKAGGSHCAITYLEQGLQLLLPYYFIGQSPWLLPCLRGCGLHCSRSGTLTSSAHGSSAAAAPVRTFSKAGLPSRLQQPPAPRRPPAALQAFEAQLFALSATLLRNCLSPRCRRLALPDRPTGSKPCAALQGFHHKPHVYFCPRQ